MGEPEMGMSVEDLAPLAITRIKGLYVDLGFPEKFTESQLDRNRIPGQNFYKMHPHFTRNMCQNPVLCFGYFNSKHGIGQRFNDGALNDNRFLLRHALYLEIWVRKRITL